MISQHFLPFDRIITGTPSFYIILFPVKKRVGMGGSFGKRGFFKKPCAPAVRFF